MGQICRIDFEYGAGETAKALPEEQYARLLEILMKDPGHERKYLALYGGQLVMSSDLPELTAMGLKYTIKQFKGNYVANEPSKALGAPDAPPGVTHYHVHIPNLGLLMIEEVTWMEDACTQELQGMLDEGWRMIAVCPPNSTRRPTYILGRSKKDPGAL